MTALLEERDRPYETTEETDVTMVETEETEETITEETDATVVETVEMEEAITQEMITEETHAMDATETDVLTTPR